MVVDATHPCYTHINQKGYSISSLVSQHFVTLAIFDLPAGTMNIQTVRVCPKAKVRSRFSNEYGGELLAIARRPHWDKGKGLRD